MCRVIPAKKWRGPQDASGVCAVPVCGAPPRHLPQPNAPPTEATSPETPPWQCHWQNCGVKGCTVHILYSIYLYMYVCTVNSTSAVQENSMKDQYIVMITFVWVDDSVFSYLNSIIKIGHLNTKDFWKTWGFIGDHRKSISLIKGMLLLNFSMS